MSQASNDRISLAENNVRRRTSRRASVEGFYDDNPYEDNSGGNNNNSYGSNPFVVAGNNAQNDYSGGANNAQDVGLEMFSAEERVVFLPSHLQ